MYKIVICDDDKNFISYMKEMLLRCGLSERQVTFYEERRSKKMDSINNSHKAIIINEEICNGIFVQ